MKTLVICLMVAASFSQIAQAKSEVTCEVVEYRTPDYGPSSYHGRGTSNYRAVCEAHSVHIGREDAVRAQRVLEANLGRNCSINQVSMCPSYGPSSYNCSPRTGYNVVCGAVSEAGSRVQASAELVRLKYELESRIDH